MRIFSMGDRWCNENRIRLLESRMMRKYQVRFGGGQTKKGPQSHLVGWLPTFRRSSHGFRPQRGCHTALSDIYDKWTGTTWFIEGDIAQCFDSLDHQVLLSILREKLHDGRFLRLIETLLQAGYLEDWRYHATLSGCPQGSILSPVLANIYLDKLDTFVETELFPAYIRGRGHRRRTNPAYASLQARARRLRRAGQWKQARHHRRQMQQLPSLDPTDPGYRRMHYLRYADDWLIGFIGPRNEAEEIKQRLKEFLQDTLKLTLSETKDAADPCAIRTCTVPWLRDCGGTRRSQARLSWTPQYQRTNRTQSAQAGYPSQMSSLSATRQADPPAGTHQ